MAMAPPEAAARPVSRTVTVALAMMAFSALLSLAVCVMIIHDFAGYSDVAHRAGRITEASRSQVLTDITGQRVIDGLSAGSFGFIALALAVTAVWARRLNIGRILACVTVGLQAVCCGGMMGFLNLVVWSRSEKGNDPYLDEVVRLQYDAEPEWAKVLIPTSAALLPILGLTVLVLLLLPSSNRFYRPAPAAPLPPMPYPYQPAGYGPPSSYPPVPASVPPGYPLPASAPPAPPAYAPPPAFPAPPEFGPPPGDASSPWRPDPGTPPWNPTDYGPPPR